MKPRALALPLLLLATLAPAAAAQRPGTFQSGTLEIGAFVRNHWFGDSYAVEDKPGLGARVGFFPISNLSIEGSGYWVPTFTETPDNRSENLLSLQGRLLYNLPFSDHSALVVGGGGTYNRYSGAFGGNEFGPSGLLGVRLGLGRILSVRLDGTIDYMGSPNEDRTAASKDFHYGFQAGLTWLFGRGRVQRDADGDGISDDIDQCLDSPRGEAVNSSGCPQIAANLDAAADSLDVAAADTAAMPADTVGLERGLPPTDTTMLRDTSMMRTDTAAMLPDTAAVVGDTAAMPAEAPIITPDTAMAMPADTAVAPAAEDVDPLAGAATLRDSMNIFLERPNTVIVLQAAHFPVDLYQLDSQERNFLSELAREMTQRTELQVVIAGHTDTTGPRDWNEELARLRAQSVKDFLVQEGVAADRITTEGHAWDQPIDTNDTAEGRARNRRSEVKRTP